MSLRFDQNGFLEPYTSIPVEYSLFEKTFFSNFENSATRGKILEQYLKYNEDFKREVLPGFKQWVNGSFVTKKLNPRDLDIVTFIPHELYEQRKKLIEAKFTMEGAIKHYGCIDARTLKTYLEEHRLRFLTDSDIVYWLNNFTKTTMNKAKKRNRKGFIELNF